MRSQRLGTGTSAVEVVNISPNGIWLLLKEKEYFLSYTDFPWFKKASVSEIHNVRLVRNSYLRWADLDVDLEIDCLENLEAYPLVYR